MAGQCFHVAVGVKILPFIGDDFDIAAAKALHAWMLHMCSADQAGEHRKHAQRTDLMRQDDAKFSVARIGIRRHLQAAALIRAVHEAQIDHILIRPCNTIALDDGMKSRVREYLLESDHEVSEFPEMQFIQDFLQR